MFVGVAVKVTFVPDVIFNEGLATMETVGGAVVVTVTVRLMTFVQPLALVTVTV